MTYLLLLFLIIAPFQDKDSQSRHHLQAQIRTVKALENISSACVKYCEQNGLETTPSGTAAELVEMLIAEKLLDEKQLYTDGWDRTLHYAPGKLDEFLLLSYGSDGVREAYLPIEYNNFEFALDIVFVGNQLTKGPLRFFN